MSSDYYRMRGPTGSDMSVFYADSPYDFLKMPSKANKKNREVSQTRKEIIDENHDVPKHRIDCFYGDHPSLASKYLKGEESWTKGMDLLNKMKESNGLKKPQYTYRKKLSWSDEGSDLDIDRFMDRDFERMWRSTKESKRTKRGTKKIISFVQNAGDHHRISPDKFIWNGIALSALANLLEKSGIRTWITLVWGTGQLCQRKPKDHSNNFFHLLDIKLPHQPLDLNHLVTWSSHPSAQRVATFRARLSLKWMIRDGFGRSIKWSNKEYGPIGLEHYVDSILDREYIQVPRMYSQEEAEKFLNKTMIDLGLIDK